MEKSWNQSASIDERFSRVYEEVEHSEGAAYCWPSAVLASRVVTDGISFSLPYRSVKVMVRVRKKERERGERLAI